MIDFEWCFMKSGALKAASAAVVALLAASSGSTAGGTTAAAALATRTGIAVSVTA